MSPIYSKPADLATLDVRTIAADLRHAIARAERQLAGLTAADARQPLGPDKWSTQQTVGHLIDSAGNNLQRLIRLQLESELTFPGYRQVEWVDLQRYDLREWSEVLSLFIALNFHFAHTIYHANPDALTHTWQFEGHAQTLGFILVDYIGHMEHHLRQLPNYTHGD